MKSSCALADLARQPPLSIATMEESNRGPKKGLEEGQSIEGISLNQGSYGIPKTQGNL
jgi:hypothetical protein